MSKRIMALGASNSKRSINKQLAHFTAGQIEGAELQLLDLNDFEMPIYSIDREKENGIPAAAHRFKEHIRWADGIIISFAEHNGAYTVAFKNVFDWASRIERDLWLGKPMFLLATSPGGRGGKTVLDIATTKFGFMNKEGTIVNFCLPSFSQHFSPDLGITDPTLAEEFSGQLAAFVAAVGA